MTTRGGGGSFLPVSEDNYATLVEVFEQGGPCKVVKGSIPEQDCLLLVNILNRSQDDGLRTHPMQVMANVARLVKERPAPNPTKGWTPTAIATQLVAVGIVLKDNDAKAVTGFAKRWSSEGLRLLQSWYAEHGNPSAVDVAYDMFKAMHELPTSYLSALELLIMTRMIQKKVRRHVGMFPVGLCSISKSHGKWQMAMARSTDTAPISSVVAAFGDDNASSRPQVDTALRLSHSHRQ